MKQKITSPRYDKTFFEEMEIMNKQDAEFDISNTVEDLAEYAHNAWAGWMECLFSKCEPSFDKDGYDAMIIPNDLCERWFRQMATPYNELPENEKKSDRQEADKILSILRIK